MLKLFFLYEDDEEGRPSARNVVGHRFLDRVSEELRSASQQLRQSIFRTSSKTRSKSNHATTILNNSSNITPLHSKAVTNPLFHQQDPVISLPSTVTAFQQEEEQDQNWSSGRAKFVVGIILFIICLILGVSIGTTTNNKGVTSPAIPTFSPTVPATKSPTLEDIFGDNSFTFPPTLSEDDYYIPDNDDGPFGGSGPGRGLVQKYIYLEKTGDGV